MTASTAVLNSSRRFQPVNRSMSSLGHSKRTGCLDRVTAGKGEAVSLSGRKPRASEPFVKGIHQLGGVHAGSGEFRETFFPTPLELRWQP